MPSLLSESTIHLISDRIFRIFTKKEIFNDEMKSYRNYIKYWRAQRHGFFEGRDESGHMVYHMVSLKRWSPHSSRSSSKHSDSEKIGQLAPIKRAQTNI